MVTDKQMRRLMKLMQTESRLALVAAKAGMDEKTTRKYRDLGQLPSQVRMPHTWRTREDPFSAVWEGRPAPRLRRIQFWLTTGARKFRS